MISGNHFHHFLHVWLQRKIQFSGNCIPVDQNLPLWPGNEFTLSFSLQFISRSLSTHSNTERKREEKHKTNAHIERTRAPILNPATETSDPQTQTSDPQTQSSEPKTQLPKTHKNPLLRSTSCRWRRVQLDDHCPDQRPIQLSQSITGPATPITEPNTLSRWVFRHRFTVHTLTSSVRSLHLYIYIYIYLYIYIFIYFFLFINFF